MNSWFIFISLFFAGLVRGQCTGSTTITSTAQAPSLAKCHTLDGDVIIDSDASGSLLINGVIEFIGDLSIGYGVNLTSLVANGLVTIGHQLYISTNHLLTSLYFPSLKNLNSLYLTYPPSLTSFDSPLGLMNVTSITIRETNFSNLNWLKPKYIESLEVKRNPSLSDVSLPIINTSSHVSFEQNGLDLQLSLPSLQSAYNISISNAKTIDLSSLTQVENSLGIFAGRFKELSIPKLLAVGDSIMIWNNTALSKLNLPVLTNVSDDIILHGNTALQTFELLKLSLVEGDIVVNGSVTSISFPALTDIEGDVNVRSEYTVDCSSLNPYDASDVFKGQYDCNGTSPKPPSSQTSSSGTTSPSTTSNGSGGVSGGVKCGIAAGVIVIALLVAFGVFCLFRRKQQHTNRTETPNDNAKDSDRMVSELPQGGGHEISALLGQDNPRELPTSHLQGPSPYASPGNRGQQNAELDAPASSHITNVAELSGGEAYDMVELDGTKSRSELPGGGVSSAYEKP